eukprot:9270592-Heterocapsa_arctica.AAC.1
MRRRTSEDNEALWGRVRCIERNSGNAIGSRGVSHALHRQRRLRSEAEALREAYMDKLDMLSLILNLIKIMSQ